MRRVVPASKFSIFAFQSTHSLRSATGELGTDDPNPTVSIHALLAECDLRILQGDFHHVRFNPRTPCGVRRHGTFCPPLTTLFQSTHSLRSATIERNKTMSIYDVSIHALLAECDMMRVRQRSDVFGFNPRTPCGVRHTGREPGPLSEKFQSTHSLRSATPLPGSESAAFSVSIHALLAECDSVAVDALVQFCSFNPRTPCGVRLYGLPCSGI